MDTNGTCPPMSPTREEVKAQAFERLQDELSKAQQVWKSNNFTSAIPESNRWVSMFCLCLLQELKLKDEQCEKLSRVRTELESELEDLTASLFQVIHPHPSSLTMSLNPLPHIPHNILRPRGTAHGHSGTSCLTYPSDSQSAPALTQ